MQMLEQWQLGTCQDAADSQLYYPLHSAMQASLTVQSVTTAGSANKQFSSFLKLNRKILKKPSNVL
jgi:hypothetical protein